MERVSKKLPAELVNRAIFSIAIRARNNMPKVEPGTIREELEEVKAQELSRLKSGKFSRNKKNIRSFFGSGRSQPPFLALILNRRANPDYQGPYKLQQSPFKGVDRATGAQRMLAAMRRVFSTRLSSTGYFKTAAAAIMFLFRAANRGQGPAPVDTGAGGSISRRIGKIAGGRPATGNNARATFWIAAPEPDSQSGRDAIYKIAEPIWQQAMDEEGKLILKRAIEKEYAAAARAAGFGAA